MQDCQNHAAAVLLAVQLQFILVLLGTAWQINYSFS